MKVLILGSGSNGGVPEWDCSCGNCSRARRQKQHRRTRSSIVLTVDGKKHVLIDASPDLKAQLEASGLYPKDLKTRDHYERSTSIDSILLTHGHGDHCTGIFELSTGKCFNIPVYASSDLIEYLFGTVVKPKFFRDLGRLASDYVQPLTLQENTRISLLNGQIEAQGFEIPHTTVVNGACFPTKTYGYELIFNDKRLVYTPDLGDISESLLKRIEGSQLFILDGTFWWEDELERISGLKKTSQELGHIAMEKSLDILRDVSIDRVVYTHMNHTNPILDPKSSLRSKLGQVGFKLAEDNQVINI